jgi:tRNA(fMet)-specific endonuclease VapC
MMEQYLLDTNICIFLLKGKYNVGGRLMQAGFENCFISEITLAELLYGAECSADVEKNTALVNRFVGKMKVIPLFNALGVYAREKAFLRKAGTIIDDLDIFIGATAIAYGLILVTDNGKHLNRLSGIETVNWVERN